jgi:hypothetical protein
MFMCAPGKDGPPKELDCGESRDATFDLATAEVIVIRIAGRALLWGRTMHAA